MYVASSAVITRKVSNRTSNLKILGIHRYKKHMGWQKIATARACQPLMLKECMSFKVVSFARKSKEIKKNVKLDGGVDVSSQQ